MIYACIVRKIDVSVVEEEDNSWTIACVCDCVCVHIPLIYIWSLMSLVARAIIIVWRNIYYHTCYMYIYHFLLCIFALELRIYLFHPNEIGFHFHIIYNLINIIHIWTIESKFWHCIHRTHIVICFLLLREDAMSSVFALGPGGT